MKETLVNRNEKGKEVLFAQAWGQVEARVKGQQEHLNIIMPV